MREIKIPKNIEISIRYLRDLRLDWRSSRRGRDQAEKGGWNHRRTEPREIYLTSNGHNSTTAAVTSSWTNEHGVGFIVEPMTRPASMYELVAGSRMDGQALSRFAPANGQPSS